MSRALVISELRKLRELGDPEAAHGRADDILCEILRGLGYGDVVDEWEMVPKWYA